MENTLLCAEDWQIMRIARMQEAVAAFEVAPIEQPISDMQVVIVYTARIERVEPYTRGGEHVFQFTDRKKGDHTTIEWDELPRNVHAIRDEFLRIKPGDVIGALDFLSNTGLFSPLHREITLCEFQRWQQFARLVQEHNQLAAATNEAQRSGECTEVLRALTGESIFPSSFFDGCEIPQTPAMIETNARMMLDPEVRSAVEEGRRFQERKRRELWRWFHQPPCSIEWIPNNKEAEQKAMRHLQDRGFGPWMTDFLFPKQELRPVILIKPAYTLQAIAAAIYADRIRGVEWRKCAWEKCPETFRVGSRKNQRFCIGKPCRENARSERKREEVRKQAEREARKPSEDEAK